MSEEYFSLSDYESNGQSVQEYKRDEETPHTLSSSESAIQRRQEAKGEKGHRARSTAPESKQVHHQTELQDPDDWKSVSERVNQRKHGKPPKPKTPDDPADWD